MEEGPVRDDACRDAGRVDFQTLSHTRLCSRPRCEETNKIKRNATKRRFHSLLLSPFSLSLPGVDDIGNGSLGYAGQPSRRPHRHCRRQWKATFLFYLLNSFVFGLFFCSYPWSRVYPAGSLCRVGLLVITINSFVSYAVTVRVRLTAVSSRRCSSRWRTT